MMTRSATALFRKSHVLALFLVLPSGALFAEGHQQASGYFPTGPNDSVTPGKLCDQPDSTRYPENIPYCDRNVSSSTKQDIIHQYDVEFGFRIESMPRTDFKIDHLIPLCMGGSNSRENLWPQHKSVFVLTDPIEQGLCELMAQGHLTQTDAVSMIRDVKHNLNMADHMMRDIDQRLHRNDHNDTY